jgi:hypothetical protein
LEASGEDDDLRALVDAVLRPQIEYIQLGPSERAWMKICAAWVAQPAPLLIHPGGDPPLGGAAPPRARRGGPRDRLSA